MFWMISQGMGEGLLGIKVSFILNNGYFILGKGITRLRGISPLPTPRAGWLFQWVTSGGILYPSLFPACAGPGSPPLVTH